MNYLIAHAYVCRWSISGLPNSTWVSLRTLDADIGSPSLSHPWLSGKMTSGEMLREIAELEEQASRIGIGEGEHRVNHRCYKEQSRIHDRPLTDSQDLYPWKAGSFESLWEKNLPQLPLNMADGHGKVRIFRWRHGQSCRVGLHSMSNSPDPWCLGNMNGSSMK